MKKRLLMICLAGVFVFSLSACGQQSAGEAQNAENAAEEQQEQDAENVQKPETQESAISENEKEKDTGGKEDASDQNEGESEDEESAVPQEGDDMVSFWGSTTIATGVSDSYASIQDAYVDGGMLVINGTYDITTDEGEVLDTSDAGEHSFPISGNASMGSMGGDGEPETMDTDEFNEVLQYDLQNNPGLGLIFCVENEKVVEIWITS